MWQLIRRVQAGEGFHQITPRLSASFKSTFNSNIVELEDATFTCDHPGLAAKYKYSCSKISNYCVRTYKDGVYLSSDMLTVKTPGNKMPFQPTKGKGNKGNNTSQFDIDIFRWKNKYKEWFEKAKHIDEFNKKLYPLFDEKCSPGMNTQVKILRGFKIIKSEQDSIKLLGIIWEIICRVQHQLQNKWDMLKA